MTHAALARFQTPSAEPARPGAPWRPSTPCAAGSAAGPAPDPARDRQAAAPGQEGPVPGTRGLPAYVGTHPSRTEAGRNAARPFDTAVCVCVCACLCTRKHALVCGAGAWRRAAARSAHTSVRIQTNRVWQGGRTCETPNVWCIAAGRKGRTSRSEWERAPLSVPAALCLAGPRPRSGVTRLWPGDAGARDSAGRVSRAPSSCPGDQVCLRRDSAPGPEPVSSPGRGRTRSGFGTSPSEPGKRNSCEGAPALSDSRAGGENSVVYIFIFLSYLRV